MSKNDNPIKSHQDRSGLYLIVFCILLNTCSIDSRVIRIERTIDNYIEQVAPTDAEE